MPGDNQHNTGVKGWYANTALKEGDLGSARALKEGDLSSARAMKQADSGGVRALKQADLDSMRALYDLFRSNLLSHGIRERDIMPFELFRDIQISEQIPVDIRELLEEKDHVRFFTKAYWMLLKRPPSDADLIRAEKAKAPIRQYQRNLIFVILQSEEFRLNEVTAVGNPWKDQLTFKQKLYVAAMKVFKKLPQGFQDRVYRMLTREKS